MLLLSASRHGRGRVSGINERVIPQTVAALGGFGLEVIAAGHCTGWRVVSALANPFGDGKLISLAVAPHCPANSRRDIVTALRALPSLWPSGSQQDEENQIQRLPISTREIIQQAIWLYLRFTPSLRDVEDLLAERGIAVSYESVRRWVAHFGSVIAADLRKRRLYLRKKPSGGGIA